MGDVNIEVLDGGLGLVPSSGDEVHAVIGCSSIGSGGIVATRSIDNLIASRGYGPGIEAAASAIKQTGKTVLFCKVPGTTPGKVKGSDATPVVITGATNASPIVVTAAAHGLNEGDVAVVAAVVGNTAANGTWKIHKLSSSTFSLVGSTGNAAYTSGGTVTPTGVNMSGTGTSVHTVTGAPYDDTSVIVSWLVGGTRGTAGAKFKYSTDGGVTYSPAFSLGTAVSYQIPNSGITLAFGIGTFVANDLVTFKTTAPQWGASDVSAAIAALGAATQKFRLIHLVGPLDSSDAITFDVDLESLATAYRFVGLLGNARDIATTDADEDAWIDALAADFGSFDSARISVAAGHYLTSSPISGRRYRRPLSFTAAARLMGRPIQEHAGRVRTGALKGIGTSSTDGALYHDSRLKTGLVAARFLTARTRIGRPGLFVDSPAMMSSPSSDYQIWPHRSVIDKACDITYEVLVDVLNDDLQLDPNTGHILDKEAKAIESRLRSAFRDGLLAKRAASAVNATISRDDNIITTKTLTAAIRVLPKGYVEAIDASVGFTNPALELG